MHRVASGCDETEARTPAGAVLRLLRPPAGPEAPVLPPAGLRRFELGADHPVIDDSGTRCHVWFVQSGMVRLQHFLHCGKRRILGFALPGELVGVGRFDPNHCSVETVADSVLYRIDRPVFDKVLQANTDLRRAVYRQQDRKLETTRAHIWMLSVLSPEQRLCSLLARDARRAPGRAGNDGELHVAIAVPRNDLADFLGTTVETISRITHRLAQRGLIEIVDPANFRIRDLAALRRAARASDAAPKAARPGNSGSRRFSGSPTTGARSELSI